MTAAVHRMNLDVIRMGHGFEGAARMTRLPTAFLTTLMPQTLRFLGQSIAGRWLTAVVAVSRYLIFQLLNALG